MAYFFGSWKSTSPHLGWKPPKKPSNIGGFLGLAHRPGKFWLAPWRYEEGLESHVGSMWVPTRTYGEMLTEIGRNKAEIGIQRERERERERQSRWAEDGQTILKMRSSKGMIAFAIFMLLFDVLVACDILWPHRFHAGLQHSHPGRAHCYSRCFQQRKRLWRTHMTNLRSTRSPVYLFAVCRRCKRCTESQCPCHDVWRQIPSLQAGTWNLKHSYYLNQKTNNIVT